MTWRDTLGRFAVRDLVVPFLMIGTISFGVYMLVRRKQTTTPWTEEMLCHSETAKRLGIDNSMPASLQRRGRGLGVIAGRLVEAGFRVNSGFRSDLVTAAIYREKALGRDLTPDEVASLTPRNSNHGDARALDVDRADSLKASSAEMQTYADALHSDGRFASLLTYVLVEGDHIHLEFNASALESLGG